MRVIVDEAASIATYLATCRPVELVFDAAAGDGDPAAVAAAGVAARLHARNILRARWLDCDLRTALGDGGAAAVGGAGPAAIFATQILCAYMDSLLKGAGVLDGVSVVVIEGKKVSGVESFMELSDATLANLEVLESEAGVEGTVFGWLDCTKTACGRRLLREWVARPLLSVRKLRERQCAVTDLLRARVSGATTALKALIAACASHADIETCLGRAQRIIFRVRALDGVSLCDKLSVMRPALKCLVDIMAAVRAMAEIPASRGPLEELRKAVDSALLYRVFSYGSAPVEVADAGSGGSWPDLKRIVLSPLMAGLDEARTRAWLDGGGGTDDVLHILRGGGVTGGAVAAVESARCAIHAYIESNRIHPLGKEAWISGKVVIEVRCSVYVRMGVCAVHCHAMAGPESR